MTDTLVDDAPEAEHWGRLALELASVGYAVVDRAGKLVSVNRTLRRMLHPDVPLDRQSFAGLLQPGDDTIFLENFPTFFDQEGGKRLTVRLRAPHGDNDCWIEVSAARPPAGGVSPPELGVDHLLIAVTDIRQRKRLENDIFLAEQIVEHCTEGICLTSLDGTILRVNHAFSVVTGYLAEEVLGKNPSLLKSGRHEREFYDTMWAAIRLHGHWEGKIWNRRKNGEVYAEWLAISGICDTSGRISNYIAMFSDITERKVAEQKMEHLAHHDILTSLPNRLLFHDRLKQALIRTKRYQTWLAVMLLDLDNFKEVNDQLGHDTGDQLLQQVARRLEKSIRASDTLARLGGDEFVALLPSFDVSASAIAGAAAVAGHIVEQLSRPFILNGHTISITTSLGIAIAPQDGSTISDLIKHADTAMYSAKAAGRNNYQFYSAAMHQQSRDRSLLEQGLREAQDNNELFLLYQPRVHLTSGRIVGLEALLRWRRDNVPLRPDQFLRVAEESGLIVEIGAWVIDQACAQAARVARETGEPIPIAINLSCRQLLHSQRLLKQLDESMTLWGTKPQWLEIEVTEEGILQEARGASRTLAQLKKMGLNISLDDFGTGYGSLTNLRRFPVDTLKIDRSFIGDIGRDVDAEAIVRSVLVLSRTLKLSCVAEGIENETQHRFLVDNGCESGQGYYFSHPLRAEQLEFYLRETSGPWNRGTEGKYDGHVG